MNEVFNFAYLACGLRPTHNLLPGDPEGRATSNRVVGIQ